MLPFDLHHEHIAQLDPSMRRGAGEDLGEWQAAARKKLAELLGIDRMVPAADDAFRIEYEKQLDGFCDVRFTFSSEEGYTVPCHLWIPDGVKKAPMVICLQGHSTGMHISMGRPKYPGDEVTISGGDRDFAVQIVKEGYIALVIEQRCFGECGGKSADLLESGCSYASMTALLYGRTVIGERVFDTSRAIDVVLAHFSQADAENIGCMGNSGGGTATTYIGALEPRVKISMPSCAVCTFKDSIAAMAHCHCNFVPHIAEYFDMAELCGMIAPRKLIVVNGAEDPIFPKAGVEETLREAAKYFEAAGVPENLAHVEGPEGHRFYAAPAWPVYRKMLGK